jgi:two-component system OmpR family sensor kinase
MAGQEVLSSHRKARPSLSARLRQLPERVPLRTKLIAAVLALVVMALAAISVASVIVLRSYVYTQRDTQLVQSLRFYERQLTGTTLQLNAANTAGSGTIIAILQPGKQLTTGPGFTPPGGMGAPRQTQSLPELPSSNWASPDSTTLLTTPAQSGGDTWRVIGQAVTVTNAAGDQQTSIMLVAVDLGPVGAEIQRLITVELIVGSAIVLVLAVVGAGVVRANLRPLDDIEMIAGEIAKGHLDHRIPERDPHTEIGSLGRSLNIMLSQIETAFRSQEESERAAHESEERMRRFIADASHELRTPLTTIRGFAAHYRQRGGASWLRPGVRGAASRTAAGGAGAADGAQVVTEDQDQASRTGASVPASVADSPGAGLPPDGLSPQDLDHLMGRVEAEATRMGLLVEDLLTLARLDQQRPLSRGPVDLLTLAADAVQDARIIQPGRPIDLIVAPGTAFLVDGDEPRLRQVLANLVNNAITHTPAGTPIRVKIARGTLEAHRANGAGAQAGMPGAAPHGDWGGPEGAAESAAAGPRLVPAVVLDVEDDGPGMTADQARRVFERFYRADAARNRASGGTGLGLAIVAGLVSAHGGTVSVRTAPGRGADFQVKLPLSPDALAIDDPDDDPSA